MIRRLLHTLLGAQKGYAVEELVLAGAMVSSVGAFVAVNVPWASLFSSSESVVEDLVRIEQANAEFYERHRLWPHQTTDGEWKSNVAALASSHVMRYPYNSLTSFKNLVPNLRVSDNGDALRHSYGEGGYVLQGPVSTDGGQYMEIIFQDMPYDQARLIDEKLDGRYTPDEGRVSLKFREDTDFVDVYYQANQIVVE